MGNYERYGIRDRTYSKWQRLAGWGLSGIDIDFLETCKRFKCSIALLELAIDVGQQNKPVQVIKKLAKLANLPAYLVFYKKAVKDFVVDEVIKIADGLMPVNQMHLLEYARSLEREQGGPVFPEKLITSFRVKQVFPIEKDLGELSEEEYISFLYDLRDDHHCYKLAGGIERPS